MDNDKLKKANDLYANIEKLKDHKEQVSYKLSYFKKNKPGQNFILLDSDNTTNGIALRKQFLFIDQEKLMEMYLMNIEKGISEMETEFNAL